MMLNMPYSRIAHGARPSTQRRASLERGVGKNESVNSESVSVSVLIVENEWIVARGLQKTLEAEGYVVTGVVSSAHDALSSVEQRRPDLALLDIVILGPVDGVDLARQLRERHGIPAIFLTASSDLQTMQRVLCASPVGYVVKPFQETQLLSSLRLAAAGLTGPGSAATVDCAPGRPLASDDAAPPDTDPRQGQFRDVARVLSDWVPPRSAGRQVLTPRELDVVRLLLANGRVVSIAEELGVSPYTVRNHLRSIYGKLGVHSQVELIRELAQH